MARQVTHGTPSLSPRYIRPRRSRLVRWSLIAAATMTAIVLVAYATGLKTVASPGSVAAGHASIDTHCAQCHQPAKAASDLRCERCHDPIDTRRFQNPAHALVSGRDVRHASMATTVSCATCHDEHRGRGTPLASVDDRRCAACHDFAAFNRHPEFAVARARRGTDKGVEFSHVVHLREIPKASGDRCISCHVMTADQATFEPINFDTHCSRCHIKEGSLTLNGTDPLAGAGHKDPRVMATLDRLSRVPTASSVAAEKARLEAQQARLTAIANTVPLSIEADRDLAARRAELRHDMTTNASQQDRLRLLERIEIEIALRPDGNQAAPMVAATAERAEARRQLRVVSARLSSLDAGAGVNAAQSGREKTPLRGLAGACIACHRLNDDETALRPTALNGPVMPMARYSHKPHILQQGCETCHTTVQAGKSATDVNVPGVATCQECHKPSQARSGCGECHSYHPRSAAALIMASTR